MQGVVKDDMKMLEVGRCEECGGPLKDCGLGVYLCSKCGHETLSEFAKIKKYIEENGAKSALKISEGTGISVNRIEKYLREGRIEIPENSDIFIPCEKCGADIRYGKYCPSCAANMIKQLQSAFTPNEVGEIPKKNSGKMRFVGKEEHIKDNHK